MRWISRADGVRKHARKVHGEWLAAIDMMSPKVRTHETYCVRREMTLAELEAASAGIETRAKRKFAFDAEARQRLPVDAHLDLDGRPLSSPETTPEFETVWVTYPAHKKSDDGEAGEVDEAEPEAGDADGHAEADADSSESPLATFDSVAATVGDGCDAETRHDLNEVPMPPRRARLRPRASHQSMARALAQIVDAWFV